MNDHDQYRELSGGFVLGALGPEDRRRFEQHLSRCADCRSEVASLAPVPGLLGRVDPDDAEPLPDSVVNRAASRVRSEWRAVDQGRRRWRWAAAVAGLLAVVMATVALLPRSEGPEAMALTIESTGVEGEVTIDARPWGTAVHLDLEGLPQRDRYVAWVVDETGTRQQAATWGPTPTGVARLDGASSFPADRVMSVVVTDAGGTETLVIALAE